MKKDNSDGVYYQGVHYTTYEATQKQRQIERNIRNEKRKIKCYELTGNKEAIQSHKAKKIQLNSLYNNFCKSTGLRPNYKRTV